MVQPWLTSLMSRHTGNTPEKPLPASPILYFIQGPSLVCPMGKGETIMNPNKNWEAYICTCVSMDVFETHSHICNNDPDHFYQQ